MSLEALIPYVVNHNSVIIQVLTALILFFVGILAIRGFRATAEPLEKSGGIAGIENLEETLKKILEKTQGLPLVGASGDQSQLMAEIATLRSSLQEKQDQIEQLKLAPAPASSSEGVEAGSASPGLSAEQKAELESQIRDLQAKLAEYEIISEDIADLSFYKEENSKLQKQLDALRTSEGGSGTSAAEPAAKATSNPEPPAAAPAPEAPAQKSSPPEPAPAAAEASPPTSPAYVSEQDVLAAIQPEPSAALPSDDEDLMKEFAEAVSAQGGAPAVDEDAANLLIDVERMTEEASVLEKVVSENPDGPLENSLNGDLDAERLTAEAATMEQMKPEDAKLMGDFEDFMKKGTT